ncbi:hypothetical protein [Flavobacterium sp. RSSB_23]|uniref:hypothetical protein n=1 Tax=Flavobacterium sp. RSSB_23 TaxID=3447668 RepID=UPI003F36BB58
MAYSKKKCNIVITLLVFIILGCSTDEDKDNAPLEIVVTNFEPSYSRVKINWEIKRPNGVIIEDLLIYRHSKNNDSDYEQEKLIANLPSNETAFVDDDVPYTKNVTYLIKINYRDERKKSLIVENLTSEPKKFIRELIMFDRVPFQVLKDPNQADIFHILDKEGTGFLKKYNSAQNKLTDTKVFKDGSLLNNKIQLVNKNEIFLADTQGTIYRINANDYKTISTYNTKIVDKLNAFSVLGNLIYYMDNNIWCYYEMTTGANVNTGMVGFSDYLEFYNSNKLFSLVSYNLSSWIDILEFSTTNLTCFSCFFRSYNNSNTLLKPNSTDANIFAWNTSKSKIITSINGCLFNINDFEIEKNLYELTGKRYFQFAYDKQDNLYATVQGEKVIHKFNSNYELIEVIKTKLYPLFPMITSSGLKVIGGYEPVSYWSFGYGYNFNFNIKCAIETF